MVVIERFTDETMPGYSQEVLAALESAWQAVVKARGLRLYTFEYFDALRDFKAHKLRAD